MGCTTAERLILLATIAAVNQLVDGDCQLADLYRRPCEAELSCINDFQGGLTLVTDWSCIQRDYTDYDHAYEFEEDYIIHLKADNIDETNLLDPFSLIHQLSDHIQALSITNGHMSSIPSAIFNLHKAKTIDLSKNTIELINLESLAELISLNVLNVSCNQIADLETHERTTVAGLSQVHTIDLSQNAIKSIPDNYLRKFPHLLHLNLSHNYIKSFNILTFEGVTQLQTLFISDNELTTLGVFFARFSLLKVLCLDHNYLTTIEKSNFNTMFMLEQLNLSSNNLITFEDTVFDPLAALKSLDLSSNKVNTISKTLFQNNLNLQSLDISLNMISKVPSGAFEEKHIQDFRIYNNPLMGVLPKNAFKGIFMATFDLSCANITELGPNLFENQFRSLNLSKNSISKVHQTTFDNLELLIDLDLSYNYLQTIEFDTSSLQNLSYFYINNNGIKKITKDIFINLTSLIIVDLSYNEIEDVEMHSFEHLNKLKLLKLNNNPLLAVIPAQIFSGLVLTNVLDISNTNVNTIQNNAFNGMKSLKTFNSSHCNLTVLETSAFSGTGSIQIIDLSYNQLGTFSVNNSNIKIAEEIYLQYNKLQYVTGKTFRGLSDLRLLNLKGNNLIRIENYAFLNMHYLLKIDISANEEIMFNSSIFSNMRSLSVVLLSNITSGFNLRDIANTSVAGLDLSFCNISDIQSVLVYPIITLERLKMASNNIASINKSSFQKLWQLSWVDLSYNKIASIQPGSFSDNEDLSVLDLSNNLLSSLMFGVFDGLANLNTLDLSSNSLHSFSASIFHNTPRVRVVFLDDNLLDNFEFEGFAKESFREIYLGGNNIPCERLTKLKKVPHTFTVKARNGIYDTENVDGITCKSMTKYHEMNNTRTNEKTLLTTISTGSLDDFEAAVEKVLNQSETHSIKQFLDVLNKTEAQNNAFFEKLMNRSHQIAGPIYRILDNIQEYLKGQKSISVDSHTPDNNDPEVNNNYMDKSQFKKDMMFKQDVSQSSGAETSADLRYPLYFIAIFLGVLLCMVILAFVLIFFKLRKSGSLAYSNNLSLSRQTISNVMEME